MHVIGRWYDYVLADDGSPSFTVQALWRAAIPEPGRTVTWIGGDGFDPRATLALSRFADAELKSNLRIVSLGLSPVAGSAAIAKLASDNYNRREHLARQLKAESVLIPFPTGVQPASAGLVVARSIVASDHLSRASAVVIDVSAMPTHFFFPLIASVLEYCAGGDREVLVLACDNPDLDDLIVDEGVAAAEPIAGFRGRLSSEPGGGTTFRIWAPVLGRDRAPSLQAVYNRIQPIEVCPVLPFPARRPRLADDLLLEYREILLEQMQVEASNFIYADERNPFDLYRTLSRFSRRYSDALAPLGPVSVVLSTHASKLLALGVLLAAYEAQLAVVSATPSSYALRSLDVEGLTARNRLVGLWLHGAPYRG